MTATWKKWEECWIFCACLIIVVGVGLFVFAISRASLHNAQELANGHCRAVANDGDRVIYLCDGGKYVVR